MTARRTFFAVAAPGLEPHVAAELATLGLEGARAETGGVSFEAALGAGARVCLESRLATRVLLRLGTFPARDAAQLAAGLADLDWALAIEPSTPLDVRVTSHRSRLRGPRLASLVEREVDRARRRLPATDPTAAERPAQRVQVRFVADEATVSLDLAGERLDRRGYRTATPAAPLRETLAAAVLVAAGWTPALPLVDPLCGAGTVAIEAALAALGVPPGAGRSFAFERWPAFTTDAARSTAWRAVRDAAMARRRSAPAAPILASDDAPDAVAAARKNAAHAGVADAIRFTVQPVAAATPPPGPAGIVVVDPPYGRRLGTRGAWKPLYRAIGATLAARFGGWRAAILCPDRRLERELRLLVVDRVPLPHGGRRVDLLLAAL